jgi:hypothetical protein
LRGNVAPNVLTGEPHPALPVGCSGAIRTQAEQIELVSRHDEAAGAVGSSHHVIELALRLFNTTACGADKMVVVFQSTNCKVNNRILRHAQTGGSLELWFHPTADAGTAERALILDLRPQWNSQVPW